MSKNRIFSCLITILIISLFSSAAVFAQKNDDPDPIDPPKENNSNIEEPEDLDDDEPIVPIIYDESGKIESPFEVELTIGTQSAWNKKVPLLVSITPLIDASRTEIRWDSGYGIEFEEKYENYFPIAKGETETYKALLVPSDAGTYKVTVSVTDWGYGRNYTSTDEITLTLDQDLLVDPRTEGYTMSVILRYLTIFALVAIVIGVIVYFGRYIVDWLKEWLKPPDY